MGRPVYLGLTGRVTSHSQVTRQTRLLLFFSLKKNIIINLLIYYY
jgi:hypothetical protein